MTGMIRKQVYIEEAQEVGLKTRAAAEGRTEADVIREGIDLVLEKSAEQRSAEAREELFRWLDEVAVRLGKDGDPITWDRDEIHER